MVDLEKRIVSSINSLQSQGMQFTSGLIQNELDEIEKELKTDFPPDLRFFLEIALPVGRGFPEWRSKPATFASAFIKSQKDELLDAVRIADFWRTEWGMRPSNLENALEVARVFISSIPFLIPIYSNQYTKCVAAGENVSPVFSVRGTDVVHCTGNIASFLEWLVEEGDEPSVFVSDYRNIPFWTDLARENNQEIIKPSWPTIINYTYPEYNRLRAATIEAGCIAEIFRPDGRYGVSFRKHELDPISFWIAQRGAFIIFGLFGGQCKQYQFPSLEPAIDVCGIALDLIKTSPNPKKLQELLDNNSMCVEI